MSASQEQIFQHTRELRELFAQFTLNTANSPILRVWAEFIEAQWDAGLWTGAEAKDYLAVISALQRGPARVN